MVEQILRDFSLLFSEGKNPTDSELRDAFKMLADDRTATLRELVTGKRIINPAGRKQITARTPNQRRYIEAIEKNDVVFGIGVAGTGKTYLAVAMAVQYLMTKRVNRVVLARPAVEAGEKLGFLPGDLQDKVDPYLRPIYDALFDVMDHERVTSFLEKRVIEVAPLAFMRGRAQPLDAKILTPIGWMRMGDIEAGTKVIGSDGKPHQVLAVYPQGIKPIWRITTDDGSSVEACAEHLWPVVGKEEAIQTSEILEGLARGEQFELPVLAVAEQTGHLAQTSAFSRPSLTRRIVSVEYSRDAEAQCITVDADDSLYVTDGFLLTHNTLSDAFIILDEAQNTTSEQMKMFLTRIGFGSKAVITGDVTQIDLPVGRKSGLIEAQRVVKGINGIEFIEFTDKDVVRHHIVQMIVKAYDEHTRKINL